MSQGGAGRVPWRGGVSSGVGCLSQSGGGGPVPLRLHRVCVFFAVPLWQGRQPSEWVSQSIAGSVSIAAFTCLCPGNWSPQVLSSRTSAQGFFIWYGVSSIVAHKNPPLAIVAIFKARCMSDCFVFSRGFLSHNSSATIPELTASWCLVSWTEQGMALVNHRGFPLRAAIN